MKNKIWQKYFICMVGLLILAGLSINLIGYRHACKHYEQVHRTRLQDESRQISVEYVNESRDAGLTGEMFQLQLQSVRNMIGCEIWVVNENGTILMSTEPETVRNTRPSFCRAATPSIIFSGWPKRCATPSLRR